MEKRLLTGLMCAVMAMVVMSASKADPAILNFEIKGTYQDTLRNASDTDDIISENDSFTITGSYETTVNPTVETKGSINYTPPDIPPFIEYSSIVTLTHDIPFTEINTDYPSADFGTVVGFEDDDIKNGSFFTEITFIGSQQNFDIFDEYTHLFLRKSLSPTPITLDGWLEFNFHETISSGSVYKWEHDTINLNVTSFQTSVIPVPSTIFLFGTGLAAFIGTRFRRKKK